MYHTTGLPAEAIAICYQTLVHNYPRTPQTTGQPPALSQVEEIRATLTYQRPNRAQTKQAESFGASQSSTSRAIAQWTARIVEVLADLVPTTDDLDQTLIVDGTLVPCWDCKHAQGLYSGKHHTTGLNLQIACTLTRRLVWVPDPARYLVGGPFGWGHGRRARHDWSALSHE
ncbi:Hypothetical protein PROPJV5_1513 [Propionibacterium ruminifibrarum]|uniref:DDE superfamily endonuclease n=1 Tax=Propionibacterium ruminifibrarum TaxID=1962131 RepID=A0A375I568_9ACTN|nr:transposase family protein [Propionibacterium ruminifibrarum]SPF68532.1 Hypothetical protein PROPJV5_1513 [Propionibacterium ruminifibrarum]